jgi:hypothetical protein
MQGEGLCCVFFADVRGRRVINGGCVVVWFGGGGAFKV